MPWTCARVGITTTWMPLASASCAAASATPTESGSLGSTMTSSAAVSSMASSISRGARPAPGPPSITTAPDSRNSSVRPGPAATITSLRPRRSARLPRARSICSAKWVTCDPARCAGADAGLDRGADVVDVHVDVPQPLAAHDDQRVAEGGRAPARSGGMASSSASSRYITSYAGPPSVRSPVGIRATGIAGEPTCGVPVVARLPVIADSAASSTTHRPRPPASTTPACARSGSCSGVRARASRAALAAARTTSPSRSSGTSAAARGRLGRRPGRRTGWCPRPGLPTAA